ncbi:hypothetical protein [Trichlorobacter ammonificans]|uniref:GTP-binding domain protein n=1 Tax=Trichlorobacter ammonificans TaxID=2916410 RepID=A0ABM9D554_9BACT|nr:hypothetical protein [Trichlorobacter ammonificans]CAH2030373.1 GTP-binding domain protein [Trichlorobacter ammonificans]
MAVINHAKREINAKIVVYGAAGSDKGALVRCIQQRIRPSLCSPLKTMATGGDTLLFFDYVPFESSSLDGYRVCFHLYTLTGPVKNPGTWKLLLKGVDGLLLVSGATPQTSLDPSLLSPLVATLGNYGRPPDSVPTVVLCAANNAPGGPLPALTADFPTAPLFSGSAHRQEGALSAVAELSRRVMASLRAPWDGPPPSTTEERVPADEDQGAPGESVTAANVAPLSLPPCDLAPGVPATLRIPITLTTDGVSRRYTLAATLLLEAEEEA